MSDLELPSSPPESGLTLSRLLANQWVETLRQTACLEVLLHAQARIIGVQTGQSAEAVAEQLNAKVAVSLKRLIALYGASPEQASGESATALAAEAPAEATEANDTELIQA
jgi:hypothetical protein